MLESVSATSGRGVAKAVCTGVKCDLEVIRIVDVSYSIVVEGLNKRDGIDGEVSTVGRRESNN